MIQTRKNIVFWFLGGAGVVIFLFCLLVLVSVGLSDRLAVVDKIKTDVSLAVGGAFSFNGMGVLLIPYPHVVFNQCRLELPNRAVVAMDALSIRPSLTALLKGRFQPSRVEAQSFHVEILPADPAPRPPPETAGQLAARWVASIAPALGALAAMSPNLSVELASGRVNIPTGDGTVIGFRDIFAKVRSEGLGLDVRMSSSADLWGRMSLHGRIDARTGRGEGSIHFRQLRPGPLVRRLVSDPRWSVDAPDLALTVRFAAENWNTLRADFSGTPGPVRVGGDDGTVVQGDRFSGSVRMDPTGCAVHVAEIVLTQPRLKAAVALETGPLSSWESTPMRFDLLLTDVDVASTRRTVLAAAGDRPLITTIFHVVRGGQVPRFSLTAAGRTPAQMWKKGNVFLEGGIVDGIVFVPGAALSLTQVQGQVALSDWILQGEHLEARMEDTLGRDGSLILVLDRDRGILFKVDIDVAADLAQLPPVLTRLMAGKPLTAALEDLDHLQGSAQGRLTLKGGGGSVLTEVNASRFRLSATHRRFPLPFAVNGEGLSVTNTGLFSAKTWGTLGRSSFTDVSATLNWRRVPGIEVLSGSADIDVGELHPLLATLIPDGVPEPRIGDLDGRITVSDVRLAGPLHEPARWRWEAGGRIHRLSVVAGPGDEPIHLSQGTFQKADGHGADTLSFAGTRLERGATSVEISGKLRHTATGVEQAAVEVAGEMDRPAVLGLYEALALPAAVMPRTPLTVSRGRLEWVRGGATAFTGKLSIHQGPTATLDLRTDAASLAIKKIAVEDWESSAVLSLNRTRGVWSGTFSGRMTCRTLNGLLENYPSGNGWIEGDITAELHTTPAVHLSGTGHIQGRQVLCPYPLPVDLTIDSFALAVRDSVFEVENAVVLWKGRLVSVKGRVDRSSPEWRLNLSLVSDHLDWDELLRTPAAPDPEPAGQAVSPAPKPASTVSRLESFLSRHPVRGNLAVTADRFTLFGLTWHPFQADVAFLDTGMAVQVTDARLCGIRTLGTVQLQGQDLLLDVTARAEDQDLNPMLACLRKDRVLTTGTYALEGRFKARGAAETLLENLKGDLAFSARDGRIFRHIPLARLFSYLDVIEIFKQIVPDLQKEGLAFRSMDIQGRLGNGTFTITEGIIDSPVMEIAGRGDIHLKNRTFGLEVLVAPMQTVNWVIKQVPVVNQIMGGTLVSIPLEIQGDWDDPVVSSMPPGKSIEQGLIRLMKRTVQMPIELLDPVIPDEKKEGAPTE